MVWEQVQAIGLLSHLRAKGLLGPFLVVGPLSTLPNWVAEFRRWCPSLPALLYHGSRQERQRLRSTHMPTGWKSLVPGWQACHPANKKNAFLNACLCSRDNRTE